MKIIKSTLLGAIFSLASLTASAAIVEGRTANDRVFVTGGIGLEESELLKQMADKYSLQLVISSRSGAYLVTPASDHRRHGRRSGVPLEHRGCGDLAQGATESS